MLLNHFTLPFKVHASKKNVMKNPDQFGSARRIFQARGKYTTILLKCQT
ncbi:hypothetical protein HMPREF7215_0580 [Pyramidobacter piscolens W5455]|uniref:Uncharacterized protein n=1 Tax=Pyramidobacter piscolens W5455 TaxID=352165 RepID=A0ABP2HU00_9BACT|nr:hypothetical protein HMPREF7215_0580 [Pyramidobacter piscolens W5455]